MKSLLIKTILVVSAVALTGVLAWSAEEATAYNPSEKAVSTGVNKPKELAEGALCPDCEKRAKAGRLGDKTAAPQPSSYGTGSGSGSGSGPDGEK